MLAALAVPYDPLPTELDGLAAAQFVAQVLPGLVARGVEVAQQGDVLDYRQTASVPALRVTPGRAEGLVRTGSICTSRWRWTVRRCRSTSSSSR